MKPNSSGLLRRCERARIFCVLGLFWLAVAGFAGQTSDYTYTTNAGAIEITKYTGTGGVVLVPEIIDGLPVAGIGDYAFYWIDTLASLILPSRTGRIGNNAFNSCASLTNLALPYSVTNVGDYAFYGCARLTNLQMSNRVTHLGNAVFSGCTGLTNLTLGTNLISLGSNSFTGCIGLTSLSITDHLATIGIGAFSGCSRLTNLLLGKSVTTIQTSAFAYCSGLQSVALPNTVTRIDPRAFYLCTRLTNIGVDLANAQYSSLDGVLFNHNQSLLLEYPCGRVGSYRIPVSVTTLAESSFYGCAGLTSIILDTNLTAIADFAFGGCTALTNVDIPNRVTVIGLSAFAGCMGLTNISLGIQVGTIKDYAFSECGNLTQMTLPATVNRIGFHAFGSCSNLTALYFEGDAPAFVDGSAFAQSDQLTIFHRSTAAGWGPTFAGRPTATWMPSYAQWAAAWGLPTLYPNASGEQDDADGDGMVNVFEMYAGTDPTNPHSLLAFEAAARPGDLSEADKTPFESNQFPLYFQSVPGRTYTILTSDALGGKWSAAATVTATTSQKRVLFTRPSTPAFYRVAIPQ